MNALNNMVVRTVQNCLLKKEQKEATAAARLIVKAIHSGKAISYGEIVIRENKYEGFTKRGLRLFYRHRVMVDMLERDGEIIMEFGNFHPRTSWTVFSFQWKVYFAFKSEEDALAFRMTVF